MFNKNTLMHMRKSELVDLILSMQSKEMPKQPYEEYGALHCRICGQSLLLGEDNYCPTCGQAIDWSE